MAEEILPNTPESREDDVLCEIDRLGVWDDAGAERVKINKDNLEEMEAEGGVLLRKPWGWAVAGELLPSASEAREKEIIDQVDRLGTWDDTMAERVKVVKEKLDDLEEEGGVVLKR
jgi:hypothetical protein